MKYKPSAPEDQARCDKYRSKLLDGLLVGYKQQQGGGWSKDLYVIDMGIASSVNETWKIKPSSPNLKRCDTFKSVFPNRI